MCSVPCYVGTESTASGCTAVYRVKKIPYGSFPRPAMPVMYGPDIRECGMLACEQHIQEPRTLGRLQCREKTVLPRREAGTAEPDAQEIYSLPCNASPQMMIIEASEMFADFTATVAAVVDFAGLPEHSFVYNAEREHASGGCEEDDRRMGLNYFAPDGRLVHEHTRSLDLHAYISVQLEITKWYFEVPVVQQPTATEAPTIRLAAATLQTTRSRRLYCGTYYKNTSTLLREHCLCLMGRLG